MRTPRLAVMRRVDARVRGHRRRLGIAANVDVIHIEVVVARDIVRLLRPLVTWYITRRSPYLKDNRRRDSH